MKSLEGANCADLPPFVAEKYFECNVQLEAFRARVAKAICSHCVVLEECRSQAMTMPGPPHRGVIGGVNAAEILTARSWLDYELGLRARPPKKARPEWLAMTDASNEVEAQRLASDDDEPSPEC